jgi:hypothetical protein
MPIFVIFKRKKLPFMKKIANKNFENLCRKISKKIISSKFDTEWLPRIFLNVVLYRRKCFICHAGFTHPNGPQGTPNENLKKNSLANCQTSLVLSYAA